MGRIQGIGEIRCELVEWMAQQLPFPFRRFEKIGEALYWLEAQADG